MLKNGTKDRDVSVITQDDDGIKETMIMIQLDVKITNRSRGPPNYLQKDKIQICLG